MRADLDTLIKALQNAVNLAGEQLRQSHMKLLEEYFTPDGKPVCVSLRLPRFSPLGGGVEYAEVSVPKLALVPMGMMALDSADLEFWVKLSDLKNAEGTETASVQIELESKPKSETDGIHLQLHFRRSEPPEALMKVNDTLTRIVP